jgi:hypothetical protein
LTWQVLLQEALARWNRGVFTYRAITVKRNYFSKGSWITDDEQGQVQDIRGCFVLRIDIANQQFARKPSGRRG